MRKIKKEELKKILENHKHWLEEDCEDWRDMRADLRSANLSVANLSGANLNEADLIEANLSGADLRGANLSGADLIEADLSGANLSGADLRGAELNEADLIEANLSGADLRGANLSGADLRGADLRGAELNEADLIEADLSGAKLCVAGFRRANLRRANFSGADLTGADFSWADLRWAINIPFIPMACPETGSFTAYKKASGKIVKLLIPEYARRSSATGRKCRCDKALVVEIQNMDGTKADVDHVSSDYDDGFGYTVGETVCEPDFYEDRFEECAEGIHFFINRQEAVEYGD